MVNTINYRGYIIFGKNARGMYHSYTEGGRVMADTLQGIKKTLLQYAETRDHTKKVVQ